MPVHEPLAFSLRADCALHTDHDDLLVAGADGHALRCARPAPTQRALLAALAAEGGDTLQLLRAAGIADDDDAQRATALYLLDALRVRGLLRLHLRAADGATLASLVPHSARLPRPQAWPADATAKLSRFASLRREGEALVLECALGHGRVLLHDARLAAWFAAMCVPVTARALSQGPVRFGAAAASLAMATGFMGWLHACGALQACDAQGRLPEDDDAALRLWESHDLLFHTRSRPGRSAPAAAAAFAFAGELPHPPALKPVKGECTALPAPASDQSREFFDVLSHRRSLRPPATRPLRLDELAAFLWHVARVRSHRPANPQAPQDYESTRRPVASGGAMYELELYLAVQRCEGLAAGLWRYEAQSHALERVAADGPDVRALGRNLANAMAAPVPPDVAITIASRLGRVAWKYRTISYALTLKNAGAYMQQMYLVATALNLSPCAIGSGDSEAFAEAAGLAALDEVAVAEFALSGPSA